MSSLGWMVKKRLKCGILIQLNTPQLFFGSYQRTSVWGEMSADRGKGVSRAFRVKAKEEVTGVGGGGMKRNGAPFIAALPEWQAAVTLEVQTSTPEFTQSELDRVPRGPRRGDTRQATLYTTFKWLKNCHTPHKLMKCCSWKQGSLRQTSSSSSLTSLYELHYI